MPEYFLILFLILTFTLFLHRRSGVKIYKSVKQFFVLNFFSVIGGFVWFQIGYTRGHWSYNDNFFLGVKFGLVPIEDLLGIMVVTYFCLTLYKFLEKSKH